MIDFVGLKYYYDAFMYFTLIFVVVNLLHAFTLELHAEKNIKFLRTAGVFLLITVVLYLGLRPISGYAFGDMGTYANYFKQYAAGAPVTSTKDVIFHYYMRATASFMGVHGFFLLTEVIYILPMYLISKVYFKKYWFYAFFMFVVSFSFYTYGTNGIRNGLATSFFLWALCYKDKKGIMIFFFILGALFHKTLLLPIIAFSITYIFNNPKVYLKAWLLSIPASLALGSVFITLFTSLGFGDDRLAEYLSGSIQADTRFRWDFLFYSAFPIFAGWYFIVKKQFNDSFYYQIFNTYLVCNAFWVLVIRANFSNRFAYLSWFLMAIIIIYPLLKKQLFNNQQLIIAKVVTAYFAFTFLMFLIYYADKN